MSNKQKPLEERVKEIIVEHLGCDDKEVTPSASFKDDLGADSLDVVEVAMALEEEYSLSEISDDEIDKLKTVGQLLDYLRPRVETTA